MKEEKLIFLMNYNKRYSPLLFDIKIEKYKHIINSVQLCDESEAKLKSQEQLGKAIEQQRWVKIFQAARIRDLEKLVPTLYGLLKVTRS